MRTEILRLAMGWGGIASIAFETIVTQEMHGWLYSLDSEDTPFEGFKIRDIVVVPG